jgi:solute carrier family 13 (sodium-dependent dicarboxylate transporter), member 2/3/5
MLVGVPLVIVGLPITWLVLTRWVYPVRLREIPGGRAKRSPVKSVRSAPSPGASGWWPWCSCSPLAAWIFRPLLEGWLPGLSDAGIAISAAVLLFLLPVNLRAGEFVLNWEWARRFPGTC